MVSSHKCRQSLTCMILVRSFWLLKTSWSMVESESFHWCWSRFFCSSRCCPESLSDSVRMIRIRMELNCSKLSSKSVNMNKVERGSYQDQHWCLFPYLLGFHGD